MASLYSHVVLPLLMYLSLIAVGWRILPGLLRSQWGLLIVFVTLVAVVYGLEGDAPVEPWHSPLDGIGWVIALAIGVGLYFYQSQILSYFQKPGELPPSDVRDAGGWWLERSQVEDIRTVFDQHQGPLIGLARKDRPVWWPPGAERPHVHLIGQTGAGKGVWLQSWAWQAAAAGEAVILIDPKGDTWMPRVLHAAAEAAGVPYTYLDLRAGHAQANLAARLDRAQLERVLEAGFGLYRTGGEADVWRGLERRAMAEAVEQWATGQSISSWYRSVIASQAADAKEWAGRAWELARVPAINGDTDHEPIADAIDRGGVVYVRGDLGVGSVQYAVRCLTRYVMLLARDRDRGAARRPVSLILDEAAESLSLPAVEAFTQARDWGLHLVLAHTSLGDFDAPHIGASYRKVLETIAANCGLKMVFKLSADDAAWISQQIGTIQEYRESFTESESDGFRGVSSTSSRNFSQHERPFLPPGLIAAVPAGVGFAVGVPGEAPAQQVNVLPVVVGDEPAAATETRRFEYQPPNQNEAVI